MPLPGWKIPSPPMIWFWLPILLAASALGRTSELLELPTMDLQTRFIRLDVPLILGAKDKRDAQVEVDAAQK